MPSAEHESPVALAKLDPSLVTWLLTNVFEVKIPDYHHARARPTDVAVLVPRTYHADGMLVFCDLVDQPVLAVVLEVQRGWDNSKRWTWKLYVAQLETELMVNAALLVYCPSAAIARRYRGMFEFEGLSLPLRPFIFTPSDVPRVTDPELATDNPALTVFSAICHGGDRDIDAAFPALAEALRALGPKKAISYYDIVLAGLPLAPRTRWEAYMSTTVDSEYRSELFREMDARSQAEGEARGRAEGEALGRAEGEALGRAEGEALGRAEGEGRAVLTVLDARGVQVPDSVREQILACTELAQLDSWLRKAVTAATAAEVVD